jgi:thioredoxin reductase
MIDVVIVGAGPGGLSAALCLARAGRQVLVADSGSWRNVSSDHLHNFLSRDGVTPTDLRAAAVAQIGHYPCIKVTRASADAVDGECGAFRVSLNGGGVVEAHRLILATGVEDLPPDIPGMAERWGQSVVHCPYCHGWERAGQILGVLAVSDRAVHEAVHVQRFSTETTLYTNGDLAITADQRDLLRTRGVTVREDLLACLQGPSPALERLVFGDGSTAACQALFCRAPTRQRSGLAASLDCRFLDDGAVDPAFTPSATWPAPRPTPSPDTTSPLQPPLGLSRASSSTKTCSTTSDRSHPCAAEGCRLRGSASQRRRAACPCCRARRSWPGHAVGARHSRSGASPSIARIQPQPIIWSARAQRPRAGHSRRRMLEVT